MKKLRVAIVYDRVNKWGGAERVLLSLQKIFPDATLYTSVYNPQTAAWANRFPLIKTSFLQNLSFARNRHEYLPFLMPLAFENFSFDEYDLVISVTSEAAKGIITKPQAKHICICLTPTRYLWSGYREYFSNVLIRFFAWPVVKYLKVWDKIAAQRPDAFVAISEEVKNRIKRYYARESTVIYPAFSMLDFAQVKPIFGTGYFLVVSRLSRFTGYKRVDLAVKAATKLNLPLVVVGEGDKEYFKKIAGPTVTFVGKISDEDLTSYYAGCRALIFPALEDFGLAMVEANAAGKPVIAYRGGGALEIVQEGKTGEFFNNQTTESLVEVLKTFKEHDYNSQVCKTNAERFSQEKFEKALLHFISQTQNL